MGPVLIAVGQMTSTPSVASNLRIALDLMKNAARAGAKMLFLPEAADFIAPASQVASLSRPLVLEKNEFLAGLCDAAKQHALWLNVGLHEAPDEASVDRESRCFNTNVVIRGDGTLAGAYRKMHLFDVDLAPNGPTIKESSTTIAGTELVAPIAETPVGALGLQTCYDIRFSQPAHKLLTNRANPATSLTYPSAFAVHTGEAHWEALLRGRAIEGQCYVFGSAQAGEHFPGRRSWGHAMVVDPWGTVIARCLESTEPSICLAEIDLERLKKIRREMPMGWEI